MKIPEGDLFFTEEPSAKRTIISEDVSSEGNDTELVDIVVQQAAASHANSSSLPLDKWFNTLTKIDGAESSFNWRGQLKIPKIPKMFRDLESNMDDKIYDPLVVSIGPYHHGKSELQETEKLKIKMAKQYVSRTHAKKATLHEKIEEVADALYNEVEKVAAEAKDYYDLDSSSAIDDHESFTKMMFLDGCFVLEYIYSSVNGQQDMGMKIHHTAFVRRDLFLVENQLPYIVLKALMSTRFKDSEGNNMIHKFITLNQGRHSPPASRCNRFVWLRDLIYRIFPCINDGDQASEPPTDISSSTKDHQLQQLHEKSASWWNRFVWLRDLIYRIFPCINDGDQAAERPTNISSSTKDHQPLHLLDMMRKTLVGPEAEEALGSNPTGPTIYLGAERYQSAKELKRVRIRFRTNKTGRFTDVRFATVMFLYGKVTLPRLIINDSTKSMLLNMVAFETSSDCPDDYWVTSYICFLDSLINNAEDVAVLRSQNILVNCLSRDEDVADLFSSMAKYLMPNPRAYVHVKSEIRAHYNNIFKKWMAIWLIAFLSSPWFLGSIFALFYGAIQTYSAFHPKWPKLPYNLAPAPPKQGTPLPPKQ